MWISRLLRRASGHLRGDSGASRNRCVAEPRARREARLAAALAASAAICAPGATSAAELAALVVSVGDYDHLPPAAIAEDDVDAAADALAAIGFSVTRVSDATYAQTSAAMLRFARDAAGARIAVVIYSGHIASYRGDTYFLPQDARIGSENDFRTAALRVEDAARVAGRAEAAAVLFFAGLADLPITLAGVGARPAMEAPPAPNVSVAFSSSSGVPGDQINAVAVRAFANFLDAVGDPEATLASFLDAASAGGLGVIVGELLEAPIRPPAADPEPEPEPEPAADVAEATDAQDDAQTVEGAVVDDGSTTAEAEAATAADAGAQIDEVGDAMDQIATGGGFDPSRVEDLQLLEALLGRPQKREIQQGLARLGLYGGRIDAIFGPLTRAAIEEFQRGEGALATGFLTPAQMRALIAP